MHDCLYLLDICCDVEEEKKNPPQIQDHFALYTYLQVTLLIVGINKSVFSS